MILSTVFAEYKALKAENKVVKSENAQLNLFNTETIDEQQAEPQTETVSYQRKKKTKKRKKHPGRYPFPEHLPVEEQIREPDVDTSQMTKVGEEVSEHLDLIEASLKRIRIKSPKYIIGCVFIKNRISSKFLKNLLATFIEKRPSI